MQSYTIRCWWTASIALVLAVPAAAGTADRAAAGAASSRYDRMIQQYESLPGDERAAWLDWLLTSRFQPACRATMDDRTYQHAVAEQRTIVRRAAAGDTLSNEQLREILEQLDRQQQSAIEHLSREYRYVTHQAVGTNPWEFQRRMQLSDAVKRLCAASPYPFEGQTKVIGWLRAAIIEQRISSRPPMPPVPDFDVVARPGLAAPVDTTEVRTSLNEFSRPTAAELAPRIARYHASMNELKHRLFDPRVLDVDQLNAVVDQIARLGLTRIGLASDALALDSQARQRAGSIETLDDAITLARVKVSASRRQVLRVSGGEPNAPQWRTLKALGRVATRLDMLATGPDR